MRNWIDDFRDTIEISSERLRQIDDEASAQPLKDDAWSAKETLGHLIDSAANNHTRFVLGQMKDDLVFSGYDSDRWVELQKYRQAPWPQLVELWRTYNLHLAHVMSSASDEKLNQPRTHHTLQTIAFETVKETEPTTLKYLMTDYIAHLKHHLKQILGEVPA